MNGQRDLSNFTDDGDVSDASVLFFPGKPHSSQSNQPKYHPNNEFLTWYSLASIC